MSNELEVAKPQELVAKSKYATDEVLSDVLTIGDFIPYVQLMGSASGLVKTGAFPMGHFALFKSKTPIDLGEKFDCIALGWRPRCIEFGDQVISVYNPENPEFIRIRQAAASGGQGQTFGPEYLLYLPDFDELCCYMFGSKSARNEAPNLQIFLDRQQTENEYLQVTISCTLVENRRKQSWHVPVVTASESPIARFADPGLLDRILDKFNNPVDTDVEVVVSEERAM